MSHASPESTFSPAYNDLSRYGVAIGTGFDITSHVTLDIAETVIFFHSRVDKQQSLRLWILQGAVVGRSATSPIC